MFALLMSSLLSPAFAGFGDVVADRVFASDRGDSLTVWVHVKNQGDTWVPSFTVDLFGTKSGYWPDCNEYSLVHDQVGVDALDVGESKWVRFDAPADSGSYPGDMYIVVDSGNQVLEKSEVFNVTVLDAKERGAFSRYTWGYINQDTPQCILDRVDPIFEVVDAKAKPIVVAEVVR
jgi:hypothetical protein